MVNCPHRLYSELQSLANNVNTFLQCLNKLGDNKESKILEFGLITPLRSVSRRTISVLHSKCFWVDAELLWIGFGSDSV